MVVLSKFHLIHTFRKNLLENYETRIPHPNSLANDISYIQCMLPMHKSQNKMFVRILYNFIEN
jgi:hypothetical protein